MLSDIKTHLSSWVNGVEKHLREQRRAAFDSAAGPAAAAAAEKVILATLERVTPLAFRVMVEDDTVVGAIQFEFSLSIALERTHFQPLNL
jgi:hypothetical protein